MGWWLDRRTWWAERRTIVANLDHVNTRLLEKDASLRRVESALNAEPYSPLRLVAIRNLIERINAREPRGE
jgi:hypothetical protein